MKTIQVIGLPVAATDYEGAFEWIRNAALSSSRPHAVEAANTHVAALARHDKDFGETMARFDLVLPDGMPLVWAVNASLQPSERLRERVYGPTLMLKVIEWSQRVPGLRHFLLGGKTETLEKLTARFSREFPEASVAGCYSPPFGDWHPEETSRIIDMIRRSGANLVWVGLGCPRQEDWIARHKDQLPPAVYFGIGAAFAFHAGEVSQSPPLVQRLGLEWAYRLAMEPRRLFRRYLTYNSLFLYHLARDVMKHGS